MEYNKEYSFVRGFNVHGDWGSNGTTEWLNFDENRYKMMINIAKERFPGMNTVRIWLSFDAYLADKNKYLHSVRRASEILTEAGLYIIPVYFNGWISTPSFGGFTVESLYSGHIPAYERCARDTARVLKNANILMHDISNEPYNNTLGNQGAFDTVTNFLIKMIQTVREEDPRKITVGTQSYPNPNNRNICDIDRLASFVDVITLHPYNINGLPTEEFEKQFLDVITYVEEFKKPYIITESIWGAPDADGRKPYLDSEFATYSKFVVGFLVHALFTCPVADLAPMSVYGFSNALYMAFLDEEFNIRKHHDIFNRYS